ncbi:MAG: hypothetical protein ACE5NW_11535 [Acidiferrobacterales bacterium]
MKIVVRTLSVAVCLFAMMMSASVFAQTVADEIELTRAIIQTEKKAIVALNMDLSESESQAFWPVYDDYQAALKKANDRRVKMIIDYAEHYGNLSDEKAQELLDEFLSIEREKLKLKRSYTRKFRKVLSRKQVARYFQLEHKMNAVIEFELAREIPLVR